MNKTAIVSVTNDLNTDQRVHRTCLTLAKLGYKPLLVGRKKKNSFPLIPRDYELKRMNLFFQSGPLFYFEYNFRLFFFLLFNKVNILVANDLDTLLANYLASKLRGSKLVYDSHEYFTEVPELQNNKCKKSIWKGIEKWIVPKLKYAITVNKSIAGLYEEEYGVKFSVVRNIPIAVPLKFVKTRKEIGLTEDKKIIILQGSGINIQRGAEEAVEAMQYVDNAVLLLVGGGDIIDTLKKMTRDLKLNDKIIFKDKMPYKELIQYTSNADIGLSLDKDTNINYRYSLPNKLFDYIHCDIPVLVSNLPEVVKIVKQYDIGEIIETHNPQHIADKLNSMLENEEKMNQWKNNTKQAAKELSWENEEKELMSVLSRW